jgi:hypothetical protein
LFRREAVRVDAKPVGQRAHLVGAQRFAFL